MLSWDAGPSWGTLRALVAVGRLVRRPDAGREIHVGPALQPGPRLRVLGYDHARRHRNVKLPLYARAAIPEVWIVDLNGRAVEVHSAASEAADGYRESRSFGPGERIISGTIEGLSISVEEVLG